METNNFVVVVCFVVADCVWGSRPSYLKESCMGKLVETMIVMVVAREFVCGERALLLLLLLQIFVWLQVLVLVLLMVMVWH